MDHSRPRPRHRALPAALAFGLGLLLPILVAACATAPVRGSRPEDMSHDEHEQAAEEHERESSDAAAQYDPSVSPGFGRYYARADEHRRHAKAHRAAAEALEQRHEEACAGVSHEDMAACPFATHAAIVAVEDMDQGVRLELSSDPAHPTDHVVAHARCHAAHGAYVGRVDMPDCPFYVRGLRVERSRIGDREFLILRTVEPEALAELRRRVYGLLPPDGADAPGDR